ncbi:MAG TPA: TA system VapC family ribonuclease toxin [Euzebya sp.]|nr:TA system VapC family ribonuclease toxin [Euzebya sp.]
MSLLPDVNVLVALVWPNHVHHAAAVGWFSAQRDSGWATCPVTESGFIRVSSNRRVIPEARAVPEAAAAMRALRMVGAHRFWTDDVSLATSDVVRLEEVQGYRQVTDVHLLALARGHGGQVVTFDQGLASLGGRDVVRLRL